MSFSYSASLIRDIDKVRFWLRDTLEGHGPLPDDGNLEDEEIAGLLTIEGHWQRAVAAGFETLASAWRKYPNLESDQFGLSRSHISRGYAEDAESWREKWGYAGQPFPTDGRAHAFSVGFIRVDGYGDDAVVGEPDP
jgi:hypothetical protein